MFRFKSINESRNEVRSEESRNEVRTIVSKTGNKHQDDLRDINIKRDKEVVNNIDNIDGKLSVYDKLTWVTSKAIDMWFRKNNCSIIISSYNSHQIYSIGVNNIENSNNLTVWVNEFLRPMGLGVNKNSLFISSLGRLHYYENYGPKTNYENLGRFEPVYYPRHLSFIGDADIHDLRANSVNELYFVLAKFNCIAKPSKTKSFEVYWMPPWIEFSGKNASYALMPCEDRCHMNGLCLLNDKPKYVTIAAMTNFSGAWREKQNQSKGVVYDVVDNRMVCDGLWSPHSPRMYMREFKNLDTSVTYKYPTLWLLESGTGHLGYVDESTKSFVKMKFIPGFLRGLDFVNNYAVVTSSLDRHDKAFAEIPLSKYLDANNMPSKCGLWIIDMNTMDIVEFMEFTSGVTELYDVAVIANIGLRPQIIDINNVDIIEKFDL